MPLTIDLPPEAEQQLYDRAASDGVEPSRLASILVQSGLAARVETATAANAAAAEAIRRMFAEWGADDPVTGLEGVAERHRESEDFKAGMNAASLSGRPVYP